MFSSLKSDILNNEEKKEIKNLQNKFNEQKNKLKIFLNLEEKCKIGKYNSGEYYIVYPNMLQQYWRWLYNENRNNTFDYLDEDFTKFCKILDSLSNELQHNNHYNTILIIVNDAVKFIDDILPGLYSLKQTYSDTPKLIAKVDSIILVLIDFKDKTIEIKAFKKKRKTYNSMLRYRSNSDNK
jgi:hypothetical protein